MRNLFWSLMSLVLLGAIIALGGLLYLGSKLPDAEALNDVQLQVPLKIYSNDGKLMAEYGQKRRIPVQLADVPKPIIHAILATEDQRFYDHMGVDLRGLARAALSVIKTGRKSQGASTITMQVARNFFFSRKKTFLRKINEILLAIKIDHEFSKDHILELYLNKIYFGQGAYGVMAAAKVYYGKPLSELTTPQMAMLAGLPQAPSRINPLRNPRAALARRNHVLDRMLNENYLTQEEHAQATSAPLTARYYPRRVEVSAPYASEMVRQSMVSQFGKKVYSAGYQVYTTIVPHFQRAMDNALRRALLDFDRRHGYRGPIQRELEDPHLIAAAFDRVKIYEPLDVAIVMDVEDKTVTAMLKSTDEITIPWEGLSWAREKRGEENLGPKPKTASDVLNVGDLVYVEHRQGIWKLAQVPQVEGAMVAINPSNGAIMALSGGFNFAKSSYNRASQALRQPGSAFKPFIYAAALQHGFTLASIVNDAPIIKDDPSQDALLWRPQNDNRQFSGPTRLRRGLIRSRNLVSIRILDAIGIRKAVAFVQRFGFAEKALPRSLSLALGSLVVTPLDLTTAFAVFANGGHKVEKHLIARIHDDNNKLLVRATPNTVCEGECAEGINPAPRVISPQLAFLMNSALNDVIEFGTARSAMRLGRHDLAGKTGTTNDHHDAWFVGYNKHMVATAWIGFDKPKPLNEYSTKAAVPMWTNFMEQALKKIPVAHMAEPEGLIRVRIDKNTGQAVSGQQTNTMFELFRIENAPKANALPESMGNTPSMDEMVEELF